MKKILGLIAIIAVAFFLVAGIAKAAPTTTFFQSIAPTTNNTYNVGTSALKWLNAYFNQASTTDITISGKLFDSTGSAGTSGKFLKTSGTAATWTALISGDITTALGFTPQAAGNYITALTGDVTASGPGSSAATLATVNANTGSFGSSTAIPNFTVNGKGLITAAGMNVVIAPAGTLSGTTLNSTVVFSSLTSVGTLSSLNVSGNGTIGGTFTLSALTGTQCLQEISGVVSGTGSACGSGSGGVTGVTGAYPVISSGGSTPAISLAFGTTTSNTWAGTQTFTNSPIFSVLGAGTVNSTSGGTIYSTATTSLSVGSPLTVTGTLGALMGGTNSTINCQTASGSQAGCLASSDFTTFNNKQSALTFSTGLTNTGGTVTVNTAQNITTLSNLTVAGFVQTTSGGVLSSAALTSGQVTTALGFTPLGGTNPLPIANGGTASTTAIVNGIKYFDPTGTFETASTSFVRLSNGNVGIGSTTPGSPLSLQYADTTGQAGLYVDNASAAAGNIFFSSHRTTTGNLGNFRYIGYDAGSTNHEFALFSGVATSLTTGAYSGALTFSTVNSGGADTERFRVDSTGYIGVGTTTPFALMDLATTSASTLPGGAFGQLALTDTGASANLKHLLFTFDSGAFSISTTSDKYATGTPAIEIDKNGLFGIGTSTPSFQLSVQGKIYSATGGYVFPDGTVQTTAAAGGSNFFSNSGIFTSLSTGTNLGIGTTSPYSILSVLASFATTTSPFSVWGAASSTPQTLVQTFNSSGTWTKPAGNILSVKVQVVGSGGGGGASQSNSSSASGGSSSNFAAATPCIATGGGGGGSGTTGQLVPQGGDGGGGAGGGGTNNAVNAFGGGSGALETCTYTNATVGSSITVTVATGGPGSTGSGSFPSQGTGFQVGGSGGNPGSAGGAGGGSTGTPTGASTGGVTTNGNPGSTVTGVSGLGGGAAVLSTFGKGGNVTVSGGGSGNNGAVVVTVTFAAPASPFPDFVLTPITDASGNIQTQVGVGTSTPGALLTLQSNTSDDFLDLWTQISGTLVNFLQVDIYGHIVYHSDTLPTVTSCGTSPSMGTPSSDEGGRIVVGSGTATSCTVTFAHPGPVGSVAYVNVWSVNGTLAANYQQSNTPDNTDFTFHSITNFASNQIGYEVTWVK